jgi:ubiquinone/menaquinone biosynthesis C-methylase UbiE
MIMTNNSSKDHWNEVYRVKNLEKLGWYEENPEQSLRLIEKCGLGCDDPLVDVGTGETTLIEHLIRMGFRKIIAVDISEVALEKLKARLGKENASHVTWIVDDLTGPAHLQQLKDIALWHDRAVLHFLVEEKHRRTYFRTLKRVIRPGGYVIISAFSLKGSTMCSGLNVRNYDDHMIAALLGTGFDLLESCDYIYHNPSGAPRAYIYTLFRRNK